MPGPSNNGAMVVQRSFDRIRLRLAKSFRALLSTAEQTLAESGGEEISRVILFAEAHRSFRQSASFLLNQEPDLEVTSEVGTVAEGRQKMVEGGIDAAIVDVPLPDEYGVELVRELHGANPSVPVLALTEVQNPEERAMLRHAGASEVLSKEIGFEEMLAAVRRLGQASRETEQLRVMLAYEDTHVAYRDVLASTIRALRPHIALTVISLRTLEGEVKRLDPHLVVSSRENTIDPGGRAAWYMLSQEPGETSVVCLDGQSFGTENPGLEQLLQIVDETEDLVQSGRDLGGC